ncbi:MFS transporter [Komagataeibacter xylinus]|uniref:MFS transporter n=2 Tax=Komagataeibacter TaxID=1434011 RepID=A0A2V4REC6_9PROT|nr:MFS transporter [Komagataeibacter swingsii]AHI27446.1 Major facilitator family (MFS) transporter [Komagataeibacter xylinus E25]RFP03827.1 MFS transporter [Komagataeibacter xylinus]PYD68376.1 MFS transporter [Komagataeibacter swingsii]RFP03890.1 MFS transporter [Komagataeibacter xylinus]GBQ53843.1 cyanate permease [Komagataeibacter swingsii DSM 16373]
MTRSAKTLLPWLMIFGASICLRTGIASLSPILDRIERTLAISNAELGLLTTLPVLCMGGLSPLGHMLERRLGLKRSMIMALALLTIVLLLRLDGGSYGLLLFTAVGVGVGDAIIRPLLSGFIKGEFASRAPAAMSVYAASMGVGSAVAAFGTPRISDATGSWPLGLAFWALPTALAGFCWILWREDIAAPARSASQLSLTISRSGILGLTLFFGLQAGINYVAIAWLPSLYGAFGYSDHMTGFLVAIMMLFQTGISFGMHVIMHALKLTTIKAALIFSGLAILGSLSLLLAKPVPWLAPLMIGIATGGLFPVALLQPLDFARDRSEATRLAGLTQTGGYLLGGILPWITGLLIDQLGVVSALLTLLTGSAGLLAVVTVLIQRTYQK